MIWKKVYDELSTQNFIILLILGSASFFFMNSRFTLGIILGGILSIANFHLFQGTIARIFSSEPVSRNKKKIVMIKFYFRLAILSIIIYIVITIGFVDLLGLAIGLSITLLSIIGFGILAFWRTSADSTK
ncbi:MAG TPA: ATP synthase subunit I [Desulfobacteraceae bacterium]|nr:ATP synthase subunit I [Desulfobacteraceae bacterium]HPJ66434.1 ATP synthase subunit I [Desulfobacteraceae bacterium]HPQ29939.1 ATP synthase subunit I [Desulfobacteraceae bacterium]